jgi:ligand-binding sensor domain-containing protein
MVNGGGGNDVDIYVLKFVIATGFNVKVIKDDVTVTLDGEANIEDVLSQEKGLTRLDLANKEAMFFYEKDGLANNALYSLLVDGDYLWITTNNGLSRFHRRDFTFLNFDIHDGQTQGYLNYIMHYLLSHLFHKKTWLLY